jgi:hypothetical protein
MTSAYIFAGVFGFLAGITVADVIPVRLYLTVVAGFLLVGIVFQYLGK